MTSRKKILVAASTFPRWQNDSVPPFVFLLCKFLQKSGRADIVVLAPHYAGAKFHEMMDGVEVYRFPYFFPFNLQKLCYDGGIMANIKKSWLARLQVPFFLFMELAYTVYLCISLSPRPKILHAHWIIPQGLVFAIVSKLFRIPLVSTVHGSDIFIFRKGRMRHIVRYVARSSNIVTVNSTASLKALESVDALSRKKIIPMGIDTAIFSPDRKDPAVKAAAASAEAGDIEPLILAVGRMVKLKGFDVMIDAMRYIVQDFPKAKLAIIGSGPERETLEKQAEELGIRDNVIFLGSIPNHELPKHYASADIFMGHSIRTADGAVESFGVVYIEALASGVPIISTDVGGIADIIKNEVTGIVVKEHDVEGIRTAVKRLMKDERLRRTLISNGIESARSRFSWENVAKEFETMYGNIGL